MGLTNSQYNAVMREINGHRNESLASALAMRQKIHNTIPRIKEIDDEISSSFRAAGIKKINGDADAIKNFEKNRLLLEEEKAAILKQNNYPADVMLPKFHCPLCEDKGYVGDEKCKCFKSAIINYLYKTSNLSDILGKENFNTLSMDYYSKIKILPNKRTEYDNMQVIVDAAKNYVDNFEELHQNLFFVGNVGCGKTFISNCIAKALIDKGNSVIYLSAAELFNKLNERRFLDADEEYSDFIDECDLLIIDDLGTELTNERISSDLFTLLNSRINHRRSTIISTNFNLPDIRDRYSERVYSRLYGAFEFYQFFASDIRKQKKNGN